MPGPPPKRSEERRRRNKDTIEVEKVDLDVLIAGEIQVPVPVEDWHPLAHLLFESCTKSGQSIFYEPSDWAIVMIMCEQVDRWLQPQPVQTGSDEDGNPTFEMRPIPMPGSAMGSIQKFMSVLMLAEGDRRKMRMELERKKARDALISGDGKVVSIVKKRADLFKNASTGQ